MTAKNDYSEWISFAHVGRPHGLKGAFFLKTSDRRTEWPGYKTLVMKTKDEKWLQVRVTHAYLTGDKLALHADLFKSRDDVETYYDCELFVSRTDITVSSDEYLVQDLQGLDVVAPEKGLLGTVVQVLNFGAQEILEIKVPNIKETIFFPFIDAFVTKIDLEARRIEIKYIPELFENDE